MLQSRIFLRFQFPLYHLFPTDYFLLDLYAICNYISSSYSAIGTCIRIYCLRYTVCYAASPIGRRHNALMLVICLSVCPSICFSRTWHYVQNGMAQQAENWQEGSPWHGWPLDIERSKVKVTRPLNTVTKGLRTSNLMYGWNMITNITVMCGDVKGQGYNVTSSVWRVFAHNLTKKSYRNTKIGRRLSVPRLTFCMSSKVKRSKVKVTRPLWVAVQVTNCRGRGIMWWPHYIQASHLVVSVVILLFIAGC